MIKKQITRFLIVGSFSTIINYSVFYALFKFIDINYLVSSSIGFVAGVICGYQLNKYWTFSVQNSEDNFLLKYFATYLISLILGILFLEALVKLLNIPPAISNIGSIGLTTVTNFLGTKFLVFKK